MTTLKVITQHLHDEKFNDSVLLFHGIFGKDVDVPEYDSRSSSFIIPVITGYDSDFEDILYLTPNFAYACLEISFLHSPNLSSVEIVYSIEDYIEFIHKNTVHIL